MPGKFSKLAAVLSVAFLSTSLVGHVYASDSHHKGHKHESPIAGQKMVIDIVEPWSPAAPAVIKVRAAYATIVNNSDVPVAITGVSSAAFESAKLHSTTMTDGVMKMHAVEHLSVPANRGVTFEPGGLHIMLKSPAHDLEVGSSFPVVFTFDTGAKVTFDFPVVVRKESGHSGHHHGDHATH